MPKRRLGVALLLPPPVAAAVDVLRRATGATDLDRLPPHLTLVPPVNVREDALDDALDRLRDAASRTRPFRLTLGPPATFLPVNPVLYLQVGGDVAAVDALRDRVFRPPLERTLTWPFQPHVTVLDGGEPERIRAAVEALADWREEVMVDRVHLLEERRRDDGARTWVPIADAGFGAPGVVGRGGLELELSVTERLDPTAAAVRAAVVDGEARDHGRESGRPAPLAVTARRDGRVVGTAEGEVDADGHAELHGLAVAVDARGEGVGGHLVAAFASAAAERGATELAARAEADGGAAGFLAHLGFTERGRHPGRRGGVELVHLVRSL